MSIPIIIMVTKPSITFLPSQSPIDITINPATVVLGVQSTPAIHLNQYQYDNLCTIVEAADINEQNSAFASGAKIVIRTDLLN